MKLAGVELVRVDIPFRSEIGTAAGVHRLRPLLFVHVVTDEGEGWGECAALAQATAVDPALGEVEEAAATRGVRPPVQRLAARGGHLPAGAEVPQLFAASPVDRMLAAAFEMAVWDAELRAGGRSMAESLGTGPGFDAMPVGAVVGIPADRDLDTLRAELAACVTAGAARVRLKIEPGWELEPVRGRARADHPDLVLQVDANGSYRGSDEDVAVLSRLADYDVLCIEQPLPPADLVAHAQLASGAARADLPRRVALDAATGQGRTAQRIVRHGLPEARPPRGRPGHLGGACGLRRCRRPGLRRRLLRGGPRRAANLALAARLSEDATGLVSDVGDPADYLAVDPCGYPPVVNGWVRVPAGPGVGNRPDEAALGELEARRRWFPATYT